MTNPNAGRLVWYELLTTDAKAAIAFYTEVIGWKTQPFDNNYTMWVGGEGPLGGCGELPPAAKQMGAPPYWQADFILADGGETAAPGKGARRQGVPVRAPPKRGGPRRVGGSPGGGDGGGG